MPCDTHNFFSVLFVICVFFCIHTELLQDKKHPRFLNCLFVVLVATFNSVCLYKKTYNLKSQRLIFFRDTRIRRWAGAVKITLLREVE